MDIWILLSIIIFLIGLVASIVSTLYKSSLKKKYNDMNSKLSNDVKVTVNFYSNRPTFNIAQAVANTDLVYSKTVSSGYMMILPTDLFISSTGEFPVPIDFGYKIDGWIKKREYRTDLNYAEKQFLGFVESGNTLTVKGENGDVINYYGTWSRS